MRWHPSPVKGPWPKFTRFPGSADFVQLFWVHILQIGVTTVHRFVLENLCNLGKYLVGSIEIIGIQYADYIAGGQPKTLVHGMVNALIFSRNHSAYMRVFGHNFQRAVGGMPVDDDMFNKRIVLSSDALQRVPDCASAVVRRSNDC